MNKLFESVDNLFESGKSLLNEDFDLNDFESKIPHNMRFKTWDVVDGDVLYWVTQEDFSVEDLEKFASALAGTDYKYAAVTVRDLSSYDYRADDEADVLCTIDLTDNEGTRISQEYQRWYDEVNSNDSDNAVSESENTGLHNDKDNPVWIVGDVVVEGKTYHVNAKVFLEGSPFGIDGSSVSKLYISNENGDTVVNYDRGWDVKPTKETMNIYNTIVSMVQEYRNNNPYEADSDLVEGSFSGNMDRVRAASERKKVADSNALNQSLAEMKSLFDRLKEIQADIPELVEIGNSVDLDKIGKPFNCSVTYGELYHNYSEDTRLTLFLKEDSISMSSFMNAKQEISYDELAEDSKYRLEVDAKKFMKVAKEFLQVYPDYVKAINAAIDDFDSKYKDDNSNSEVSDEKKDDAIWNLIDKYEAGKLDKQGLYNELVKLNGGDKAEAKADLELALDKAE